jgi:hypothetical protein
MYGYLRLDGLHGRSHFAPAQCGLCATFGADFRTRTRLLAGPDPTLLLALLDALAPTPAPRATTRCPLTAMLRRRRAFADWPPLPLVAALQLILADEKLLDDRLDKDTLGPATAARLISADVARAEALLTAAAFPLAELRATLRQQAHVEADPNADLEHLATPTADALALIGRAIAPHAGLDSAAALALGTFMGQLGRMLYLVDAIDDLPRDQARGVFNPIARAIGDLSPFRLNFLQQLFSVHAANLGAAFDHLSFRAENPAPPPTPTAALRIALVDQLIARGQARLARMHPPLPLPAPRPTPRTTP